MALLPQRFMQDHRLPVRADWLDRIEQIFTIATLYFTTGAVNAALFGALAVEIDTSNLTAMPVATGATEAPIFLLIQFGILGLTLLFMGLRWRQFLPILMRPWLIWAYVLLAMLSSAWTPDPVSSFKRAIFLLATTLFGFYLAGRFSVRQQMLMLASALAICAFSHLTFGLLFPAYAQHVMYWAGAWRGLMTHKNALAQIMVLAAIVFQLVLPWRDRAKFWHRAGLAASVLLVFLSTSKTGLLLLLLLSLLLPILRLLRISRIEAKLSIVTLFLFILLIVVTFVGNYELILTSLGRDPSLTGRTDIWGVLLQKASRRLWFGYGFEAFWAGGMDGEALDLWYSNRYIVDTAHNGFLDMLLELGVVGLGIFLLSVGANFWRGMRWLVRLRSPEGLYPLAVLAYWLVYNLTESTLPSPYSLNWIVYVSVTTSLLTYRLHRRLPISPHPSQENIPTKQLPASPMLR